MADEPAAEVIFLDFDSLRLREIEDIEDILGMGMEEAPRLKVIRAAAWVVKRRTDPSFTMEDAGELIVRQVEPDPKAAGSNGTRSSAASIPATRSRRSARSRSANTTPS